MRVTDFVGTNAEFGPLGLSSLRTRSCRRRFATCARESRVNGMGSVSMDLRQTRNMGLGQLAELPTQTTERVEKALVTLQSIERFACDQHDHVNFAKTWMLMGKGVAHALDYDFRLVPQAVMAPLQRRLEGGLRRTLTVLLGSEVSELARERAKLATCFGGLGIRGCSDGLRGASNVLVGSRLAQGCRDDYLRGAGQAARKR